MSGFFTSFILGLLTPLTAVCVLPLYPGFISYIIHQLEGSKDKKFQPIIVGLIIAAGIIVFMALLGVIFTTILKVSLTKIVSIVSPIAFGILGLISIVLIFDVDIGKYIPKLHAPTSKKPLLNAFLFGLFFGAIVIPCNPGFIAAFFTAAFLNSTQSVLTNMLHFLSFGLGLAAPLLVISSLSTSLSSKIIAALVKRKTLINRISGIIMLGISIYYLFFVFRVLG